MSGCEIELSVRQIDAKISKAIQDANFADFEGIINGSLESDLDLSNVMYQICSCDSIKEEAKCKFAEILLNKFDARKYIALEKSFSLHIAAKKGLPELVKTLLLHPVHPANPNELSGMRETAIISAVQGAKGKDESSFLECIKLLAEKNCDLNVKDLTIKEFTAVHRAAVHGLWKLVVFFLEQNVNIDVKLGSKTTREVIEKHDPQLVSNYKGSDATGEDSRKRLVDFLDSKHQLEEKDSFFAAWLENNDSDELRVNEPYKGNYTLLQCAVKNELHGVTEKLIERDANPNSALAETIEKGESFFSIICASKQLLNIRVKEEITKATFLQLAVKSKKPSVNVVKSILDRAKAQSTTADFQMWLNARDYRGLTALHYAARLMLNDIVAVLLQFQANIFVSDDFDVPAFFYMRPELIESYLDDQIQMTDRLSFMERDYGVVFDFNFLQVPSDRKILIKVQDEKVKDTAINMIDMKSDKNGDESSPLQKEINSQQLDKISEKEVNRPEVKPLLQLAKSPIHKKLLIHPVIRAFLHLKWHRLYWFWWVNFIFYFAFATLFTGYLFSLDFHSEIANKTQANGTSGREKDFFAHHSDIFLTSTLVLTAVFALRELSQLLIFRFKYLLRWENLMELTIICLTLLLIFIEKEADPNAEPLDEENRKFGIKILAAVLSLLVYLELVFMMGRHPRLASYITMFFQVSTNFFKFLLWYMCLIFAFGVSFYILFNKCEGDNCSDGFFQTVPKSFFKTVIMISGEYEAGEIDFDNISVVSHIIFVLFLFFISIVMVNLLNGLAVSDTQQIKDESKLIYCASQAQLYTDIENTLLISCGGNQCCAPVKKLANWMASKILLLNHLLNIPKKSVNTITVYLNRGNLTEPDVRFCGENDCFCLFLGKNWHHGILNACNFFNNIVGDALQVRNKVVDEDKLQQLFASVQELKQLLEISRAKNT